MAVMLWISTLGAMKAEGTRLRRSCLSPCSFWEDVTPEAMIAQLGGPENTLWDCQPPCPVCDRLTFYLASPGEGSVYRPLLSREHDPERLPPEAWMARWFGRR